MYTANEHFVVRIKYISAYYIHQCLKKFYNGKCHTGYGDYYSDLKETLANEKMFNRDFRSCMTHYSLINKGIASISLDKYDENKLFFGLINSCFHINEDEYITLLDDKLEELSIAISNIANLEAIIMF